MMHLARLAGLDDEPDRGAQALPDQVMMHGRAGEQRRHRNALGAGAAVGQDDDVDAVAHRRFGARAQPVDLVAAGRRRRARPARWCRVKRDLKWPSPTSEIARIFSRSSLVRIGWRTSRRLSVRRAFEVEQVRPRPDDRDQAHHQLLADRVDRRVGDLREVLLEIGEQELRLVRQRRDRRVGAHRADGFLALDRHRRHQELQVFLGVAEGLLAIEQRQVGERRPCAAAGGRSSSTICVLLQPLPIGMALGERRLELLVGNEPAFVEIDQQHLAGLQPPLGDDVLLRDRQHAHLRGHDDAVVAGDEVARGAQAVAVERGADLAAVGEGDRGRAVPRLHQRGVVFVEGAPLLVHERIARPGLGDHHHHRVRERVAALHQEFERVVEAGGVGLAFVGDRPQLADVVAEQRRGHRRLPRRHPVDVAAQRVDLAVVGDHPVGMRERPGREGVGGEALVHERERALEIRVVQVGIVGAELVGEEHALVDDRAAGDRHRVIVRQPALAPRIDRARDRLAQDVEPALELVLVLDLLAAADEHLLVHRLGRLHRFAERRIVGRHVAPAEQRHALALDRLRIDVADDLPPVRIARHEQLADRVFAGRGQLEAELRRPPCAKNLCGICTRMPAPSPARGSAPTAPRCSRLQRIASASSTILCDLRPLMSAMKPTPQESLSSARIVEALRCRQPGIGGVAERRMRTHGRKRLARGGLHAAPPARLALWCRPATHPRRRSCLRRSYRRRLSPSFADDPRRPARPVAWSAAPIRAAAEGAAVPGRLTAFSLPRSGQRLAVPV